MTAPPTMFPHFEVLVIHDSSACSDDEYEEDGTDSDLSKGIANDWICEDNTNELHYNTPAEQLCHNNEVSAGREARFVASNDAGLDVLEASFVCRELNALTMSAVQQDGSPEYATFHFHPKHILCEDDYVHYLVSQSRCPAIVFANRTGRSIHSFPPEACRN